MLPQRVWTEPGYHAHGFGVSSAKKSAYNLKERLQLIGTGNNVTKKNLGIKNNLKHLSGTMGLTSSQTPKAGFQSYKHTGAK